MLMMSEVPLTYSDLALMISTVMSVLTFLYAVYIGHQVKEVHLSLNSRLDAFLISVRKEGVAEGRETQRNSPT